MKKTQRLESEIEHFDKLEHVWWGARTVAGQKRYDNKARLFRKLCKIKKNDRILEIGCGDGEFTKRLTNLDNKIFAIDATLQLIKLAKENIQAKNITFLAQDAENLKFKDGSFDIICGVSILHHTDCGRVLKEVHRLLKPKGRIFFTEPNILNPHIFLAHKIGFLRNKMELSPGEIAFTRWNLEKILRGIGFRQIVVKNYDFLYPKTPSFAIKFIENLGTIAENIPIIKEISGSLLIYAVK